MGKFQSILLNTYFFLLYIHKLLCLGFLQFLRKEIINKSLKKILPKSSILIPNFLSLIVLLISYTFFLISCQLNSFCIIGMNNPKNFLRVINKILGVLLNFGPSEHWRVQLHKLTNPCSVCWIMRTGTSDT